MKVAVRRTGLSPHAIRVWERRYGAVQPHRTETNRRLYSDDDIARLCLLRIATEEGHSIGQVAQLKLEQLQELIGPEGIKAVDAVTARKTTSPVRFNSELVSAFLDRCTLAAETMDVLELERALLDARVSLSVPALLEGVIAPLLAWLGESWRDGITRVAHEHLTTATVRRFLDEMRPLGLEPAPGAPAIVIATPRGQMHDLGALMVAIVANTAGWRDVYLGANSPIEDIAHTAREVDATLVALSIVFPADDALLIAHLKKLVRLLPESTRVLLGGASAFSYHKEMVSSRVVCVPNLPSLRDELDSWNSPITSSRTSTGNGR